MFRIWVRHLPLALGPQLGSGDLAVVIGIGRDQQRWLLGRHCIGGDRRRSGEERRERQVANPDTKHVDSP